VAEPGDWSGLQQWQGIAYEVNAKKQYQLCKWIEQTVRKISGGNRQEYCEDALQQVWMEMPLRLHKVSVERPSKSYAARVVFSICEDYFRKVFGRQRVPDDVRDLGIAATEIFKAQCFGGKTRTEVLNAMMCVLHFDIDAAEAALLRFNKHVPPDRCKRFYRPKQQQPDKDIDPLDFAQDTAASLEEQCLQADNNLERAERILRYWGVRGLSAELLEKFRCASRDELSRYRAEALSHLGKNDDRLENQVLEQVVLALVVLDGFKKADVAALLGKPDKQISRACEKALARARDWLENGGEALS
jgi:DNA-directed RNA polymerase specialized sigma24 family protein